MTLTKASFHLIVFEAFVVTLNQNHWINILFHINENGASWCNGCGIYFITHGVKGRRFASQPFCLFWTVVTAMMLVSWKEQYFSLWRPENETTTRQKGLCPPFAKTWRLNEGGSGEERLKKAKVECVYGTSRKEVWLVLKTIKWLTPSTERFWEKKLQKWIYRQSSVKKRHQ